MTDQAFRDRFQYDPDKDLIGSGGFGSVYRAYDYTEKRYVALKISQVKDIYGKFTLLNEVELSKKIDDHTNVARYELGYRFKVPFPVDYAIMAYYEEGNLDMVLRKRFGHLTDKEYYEIVEGLLEGIGHLHNENIIHRDLKLANILMLRTKQGQWRPKIADFGLSRQIDDTDASIANSAIGITIAYAAPEQIEGNPIRKNVDLWALGVIVYRLLTGDMPFAATQNADPTNANLEMSRKITQVELPEKLNYVPEPYQTIIRRCFVKDTKDRPQSAYELLDILKRFKPDSNSWKDSTTQSSLGKPIYQSSPSFDEPIAGTEIGTEISAPSVPKPTITPKIEEIAEESTQLEMPSSSNSFVAPANEGETLIEPQSAPKSTSTSTSKSATTSTSNSRSKNVILEKKAKNTVDENRTLIEPQSVPKAALDENKTLIESQVAFNGSVSEKQTLSGRTKKLIGAGLVAAILSFGICKFMKPSDTSAMTSTMSTETTATATESNTVPTVTTTNVPSGTITPNTSVNPKIDPKTGKAMPNTPLGQPTTTVSVPVVSTTPTVTVATAPPVITPTQPVVEKSTPPVAPPITTPTQPVVVKSTPTPPVTTTTPSEPANPAVIVAPTLLTQNTGILKLTKCPNRNCCSELVGRTIIIKNFFVESDGSISINSSSSVAVSTPSTAIKNIFCQKVLLEAFMSNYKFNAPKNGRYEYKTFSFTN